MNETILFKDLHLLTHLFAPSTDWMIVFDPENKAQKDLTGKFIHASSSEELIEWLGAHPNQNCTLFNLSDDTPLELYCLENVENIFHFSRSANSDDGHFAYKTGARNALQWIFPSKSMKKVLTGQAIDLEQESVSWKHRWNRVLFKLGLEDRLVDGYFNFYHKKEHSLEKQLRKTPHDDYYLLAGPIVNDQRLAWAQLILGKKPIHQESFRFPTNVSPAIATPNIQSVSAKSLVPKVSSKGESGIGVSDTMNQPGSAKKL